MLALPPPAAAPVEAVRLDWRPQAGSSIGKPSALHRWLRSQRVNAERMVVQLRPFAEGEFGTSASSPSRAHLRCANAVVSILRRLVGSNTDRLGRATQAAEARPSREALDRVTELKDESNALTAQTEQVWRFYWDIFAQRQTTIAPKLLASDRIALDCYQDVYQGLGQARSVPAPAPFTFLEAGSGPATFRRFVAVSKLGRLPNPFPLVKLPENRLLTPWTLGAIAHEVAHNLQSDLGLWTIVPRQLYVAQRRAGLDKATARIWHRWQKETFADLLGFLLIGPAYVGSLADIVGRSIGSTVRFDARGVHPTPFLRVLINLELLKRIGFAAEARSWRRAWLALYPSSMLGPIPTELRKSFSKAAQLAVDVIAFTPYSQLGGKALTEVVAFRPQDQQTAREAASRLAQGVDPGIVPERFLIAAARIALDERMAEPGAVSRHFFDALGRR